MLSNEINLPNSGRNQMTNCPICYDDLNNDNAVTFVPCGHNYCFNCYVKATKTKDVCCLDRHDIVDIECNLSQKNIDFTICEAVESISDKLDMFLSAFKKLSQLQLNVEDKDNYTTCRSIISTNGSNSFVFRNALTCLKSSKPLKLLYQNKFPNYNTKNLKSLIKFLRTCVSMELFVISTSPFIEYDQIEPIYYRAFGYCFQQLFHNSQKRSMKFNSLLEYINVDAMFYKSEVNCVMCFCLLEEKYLYSFNNCSHNICDGCFTKFINSNTINCPFFGCLSDKLVSSHCSRTIPNVKVSVKDMLRSLLKTYENATKEILQNNLKLIIFQIDMIEFINNYSNSSSFKEKYFRSLKTSFNPNENKISASLRDLERRQ